MNFQRSELFLILVIILFFALSLLFLVLLIISRLRKIQRLKKKNIYDSIVGNFLFSVIFENKIFKDLSIEKEYISNINSKYFRHILLDSIIKLHKSYTGEYAKLIETFYYDSSIIKESYKKLNASQWSVKCEALRELAEMNIVEAYPLINKYVDSKNLILRQEALLAVVKLKGVEGLDFVNDYKEVLSDWIQLNLISILKNNLSSSQAPDYNSFIASKNNSVAHFGKKLKAYYEQYDEFLSEPKIEISYNDRSIIPAAISTESAQRKKSILFKRKLNTVFLISFKRSIVISLILFCCFFGTHSYEMIVNKVFTLSIIYYAFVNDVYSALLLSILISPIAFILMVFGKKTMDFVTGVTCFLIVFVHIMLSVYFHKAGLPLGSDLFGYSLEDILITIKAGGAFSFSLIGFLLFFILLLGIFAYYINKSSIIFLKRPRLFAFLLPIIFLLSLILKKDRVDSINEYENYLASNKSYFFFENIFEKYSDKTRNSFADDKQYYLSSTSDSTEKLINPDYPFFKNNSTRNTIGSFFNGLQNGNKPNFVFLILEGMGSDFVGKNAKLGNFNPFLDSLSQKSLFWENALSSGGRTFAALPSIFGSLPYLKQGYLEEGADAPKANSFFKILNCNGYQCQYFTGSNSSFDKMDIFLKTQGVEVASDVNKFGKGYTKLPSYAGFSWGYGEKDIFKNYFSLPQKSQPNVSVFFTIVNHSPYLIPNQAAYVERAKNRIQEVNISKDKKDFLGSYLNEISCMIYADDALRYFFNEFSKREEFKNTIFIITGDHRAPEIPISFQIDRFRVPIIIYSPLLKRTADFKSIVTHLDITPTLLALLTNAIKQPTVNSWVGTELDTSTSLIFDRQVALMRNKNEFQDYLDKDYLLSGNMLYKLTNDLGLNPIDDDAKKSQMKEKFDIFKQKNLQVFTTKKLIPDSLLPCATFKLNKLIGTDKKSNETALPLIFGSKIATHTLNVKDFVDENRKKLSKGFYIVVASFGNKKNAKKYINKNAAKQHLKIWMIQNKATKKYNVIVAKINKKDEIDRAKYKVKYPDVWILELE